MTIKNKLFLNMLLTLAGIAVIGGVSLLGMKFVQGKLSVLTERSTPYQLKTIEMQRALQEHTANLLKVAFSAAPADLKAAREEAEKSLAAVEKVAGELDTLKANTAGGEGKEKLERLASISREMVTTTEARLGAEEGVRAADQAMKGKLQEITQRLGQMDTSIQKRQKSSARQLSASSGTSKEITQRLVNLTQARDSLKDLNFAFIEVQKATGKKAVIMGRGKIDTALGEFSRNHLVVAGDPSVRTSAELTGEVKKLLAGPQGFIEGKGKVLAKADDADAAREYDQLVNTISSKISTALVDVDQAITIASEKYNIENRNHDDSLKGSNMAGDVLALNGDLIALGLDIKSLIKELMTVRTSQELDRLTKELQAKFAAAEGVQRRMTAALGGARKGSEAGGLQGVAGALGEIKGLLLAKDGVVEKLQRVISVQAQAMTLNGKLRELVAQQTEEAKRGVTSAQADQEKAVSSVNRMVRNFVFIVSGVGLAIFLFGMVFSKILANSISAPIRELTIIAEAFGNGDFSGQMDEKRRDEFGTLAVHLNQATRRIQDIVRQITVAIHNLASSSEELSATAEDLNRGSREQATQTDQSASAMTEMSQTIAEVAQSAGAAADASRATLGTAEQGNEVVSRTVKGMEEIATSVREGASLVSRLGESSEKIGTIVTVINDIADQTNLLALNAAIEAARAGELGMGFAVVADEVRKLAARTTEATAEIAAMIRGIQDDTSRTVSVMGRGTGRVEEGMRLAVEAIGALESIVRMTAQGTEMVERIATAAEQQSSVAQQVSASVESIAGITQKSQHATAEITRSSEELARLAGELNRMAEWFKVDRPRAA